MIAGNDILGRGEELAGRSIVLGVSGGIAAYKAAQLVRDLQRAGASVRVVMTESACRFVGPATFQALSGQAVFVDAWDDRIDNAMAHIELTRGADAILLAPATADLLARLALGRADDLLTTLCLAREVPLLVAPAMNRQMWANPATKRNVQRLRADGVQVLGPGSGDQACGEVGDGRMLEPAELVEELTVYFAPKLLAGKRILMTAGPTFEPIDPVRGITNLSSGKMGYALARACRHAGAQVTMVSGPTALQPAAGVKCIQVQTAQQMMAAVDAELDRAASSIRIDCFIAVAAVADWRIAEPSGVKLKKSAGDGAPPSLELVENPDILAAVARRAMAPYCVGFAAESHDLATHAQAKREKKGIPLVVGNIGPQTFGKDDNELVLFEASGSTSLGRASKQALARRLVQELASRLPDGER
ncbi:MAG: bifunctional phosphopantothenoylcysteine decarboxylase/phosphopantothenate--cysteine ligase CoaBC [Lautropia sp.]